MNELHLNNVSLTNFRGFARCNVSFERKLTVLVADNGGGKTAVLDAAAAALSVIVNALYPAERVRRIERSDVRLIPAQDGTMEPCLPTQYEANGIVQNTDVTWKSSVRTYGTSLRPSTRHLTPLRNAAASFQTNSAVLPLIAYYGTGRLWGNHRLTEYRRSSVINVEERATAYADCLTSSSSFKGISAWFEHRALQTASPAYRESLPINLAMVAGVKQAADTVLKPVGWSSLQWDSVLQALTAEHQVHGRLPLSMLSDGVRTMLALVADVARRCASLNPHLSDQAPAQTPGILIVDEIDMHLHPRWQQQVLGLLQGAFPCLQIIVSTHSPHVLSTADNSAIRVLHASEGEVNVETPKLQTRGVESSDVLATVMDVDPAPQTTERMDLNAYRALIEDGQTNSEEALNLRSRLIKHFGQSHPVIIEIDRLVRFQKYRLARSLPERG